MGMQGWEWVDEVTRYGAHKYGFVSLQPGSLLHLMVDSRNPHPQAALVLKNVTDDMVREAEEESFEEAKKEVGGSTTLSLGILKSYEKMGMGSITCVSGCTCYPESTVFDSHWDDHVSLQKWVYFGVSEDPECVIEVQNLAVTISGSHKLKVMSLGVLPFPPKDSELFSMWVVDGLGLKSQKEDLPHTSFSA
eukprot:jgi/Botrbrau1/6462/Bobra.0034s0037.1